MAVSKRQNTLQDKIVHSLEEKKMLIPVAFLAVLLIDIVIFYGTLLSPQSFCFGLVGIGILTPYGLILFRITNPKKLLILVTVLFLILAPLFTVMSVENVYSNEPVLYSSDSTLKQGTVDPYIGNGENSSFDFTVLISSKYLEKENTSFNVYLNITDMNGKKSQYNMSLIKNGTYLEYQKTLDLDKGVYTFFFALKSKNATATSWKNTTLYDGVLNGVLNVEKGDFIIASLPMMYMATFMYFGFLSYIIVGMYWWTRIAKERKRRMVTVKKEEGSSGGLKCPVCGNPISEGTETCPYCGAELEHEEDEEEHGSSHEEQVGEDEAEE